jgi:hypothetical protein
MVKEMGKAMATAKPAVAAHLSAPKNPTTKKQKKDYKKHKKQK